MISSLKKILKNKTTIIFALLVILFLPPTIYMPAESNRRLVVSAVAVDKSENNEIELSVLMVIPKSGGNIGNNYQLVSNKGYNLAEALNNMGTALGKQISFAHCEIIIISTNVLSNNLATYLDFFTRTNNLTANADLVCAKNAKEVLEANITTSKEYTLSLKDILTNNKLAVGIDNINVDNFFKEYLSSKNSYLIPYIKTNKNSSKSNQSSESSGNESSENMGSTSNNSSTSESNNTKELNFDGSFCLLKNGKAIEIITKDQSLGLNITNSSVTKGLIELKNVTDTNYKNADVTLEILEKKVKSNIQIINNTPYLTFDIFLFVKLEEVYSENFDPDSLATVFNMIGSSTLSKTAQTINSSIATLQNISKEHKVDIFNITNQVRAHHFNFFKNYTKTNSIESLIENCVIVCNYEFSVRN